MNTVLGEPIIYKLKKISLKSLGIILSALHTLVGLMVGIIVTFGSLVNGETGMWGLGAWSILVLPIINGILGFLTGCLIAGFYNFIASRLGGIVLEFEKAE